MGISEQLSNIADSLENAYRYQRVMVNEEGVCSLEASLVQRIVDFIIYYIPVLSCLFSCACQNNAVETYQYFETVFGGHRVERISSRMGLELSRKKEAGLPMTVHDVEMLFLCSAEVRREDIEEIALKPLELLSKQEVDCAYKVLIPFDAMDTIFLNHVPDVNGLPVGISDLEYLQRRIYLVEEMRRDWSRFRDLDEVPDAAWQIRLMKRIVNEHLPKGTMVPHPDGYFATQEVLAAGGAFAILFKSVAKVNELRSMIAFLGTRDPRESSLHRESVLNNLQLSMGVYGTDAIAGIVEDRLLEERGFVVDHEKVDMMGFSLGGVHAQRLALKFHDRVDRLTTVSSPGIDLRTAQTYNELQTSMKVRHIAWFRDAVSSLGEMLVGNPEKQVVEFVGIDAAEESPIGEFPRMPEKLTDAFRVLLVDSFLQSHNEEALNLGRRVVQSYLHPTNGSSDTLLLSRVLNIGNVEGRSNWEEYRKHVASAVSPLMRWYGMGT